jgi:methylase of polypeptide subunit release factors
MRPDADAINQLRRLKTLLEKHSYNAGTLNDLDTSHFWLPATLYKLKDDTAQNILIRLFLIGQTISESEITKIFSVEERDALVRLGILQQGWRACIKLFPYKEHILFCDFDGQPKTIEPIYAPGTDSFHLEEAGIDGPFRSALDLCTGSGIQALRAAAKSRSVIATDVNPRAVHWLSISLALNQINNVDIRLGNLYQPVQNNRFDYITANPPFVITREESERYLDGGTYGDDVWTRILHGLPDY